ncbi:TM2 domain-containing protein Y66D12A.21,TM2 domain-containing protein 1,TM2 domain-containing protein CG10795 [Lepeophtheirus salmonis]|uniref:TM2 domain-containing protein Y66D12A.21,TM2 domain-containing protein 1,TM2 domain-containing protein CG10795 n=1 Tax=Lepeophtheirus salmonis TaxID=72036 RepID=A0A7R8CV76_LEPSM|nr:TM2 domain-containing protein CG10795-like [Lepeophtheirus salmonis]CAB4064427.1 TM2 domain-containing protein Y66D12A.21,TM2 domain-containing protein 1,TM2 domain-containing protein CG10795 [Lepeophtheirus salmonis]CAF2941403.1 TM2 domain-containing protein Y66D12A.21,TM2 domain-containing protein 1,TM2 domain-containing protein CG10795 [Lepeophtheirus salmonis]
MDPSHFHFFLFLSLLLWVIPYECHGSLPNQNPENKYITVDCSNLLPGQYLCSDPDIDAVTQEPVACTKEGLAPVPCEALPGLICTESGNRTFTAQVDCRWTNGVDFQVALILSIFFGAFGIDRFYLGYPAIGFLKLTTLGFFFLGHLLDVILIASQTLGPADGSHYIINYYGPRLHVVTINNHTLRKPQLDWY